MSEHTPTPWKLSDDALEIYSDPAYRSVAMVLGDGNERANATFIVNAANGHDALVRRVAALEQIIAEDLPPWNCRDEINKMLVDEIWRKRALLPLTGTVVGTGSKT